MPGSIRLSITSASASKRRSGCGLMEISQICVIDKPRAMAELAAEGRDLVVRYGKEVSITYAEACTHFDRAPLKLTYWMDNRLTDGLRLGAARSVVWSRWWSDPYHISHADYSSYSGHPQMSMHH